MGERMGPEFERLFQMIAADVEKEFGCGGLTGGLYEDFAHEILVRFLGAIMIQGTYGGNLKVVVVELREDDKNPHLGVVVDEWIPGKGIQGREVSVVITDTEDSHV